MKIYFHRPPKTECWALFGVGAEQLAPMSPHTDTVSPLLAAPRAPGACRAGVCFPSYELSGTCRNLNYRWLC